MALALHNGHRVHAAACLPGSDGAKESRMFSSIATLITVLFAGLPASAQQNTPTANQGIGAASSSGIFSTSNQSTQSSSSTSTARAGPSFSTPRINIDETLRGRVCDPLPDSEPSLSPQDHC
jgi:hypothetical protein